MEHRHQISAQHWKIEQEQQALPLSLQRSTDTDYTSGYFFVTLNVRDKYPLLGSVRGRYNATSRTVEDIHLDLTDIGHSVEKCWLRIPEFYPDVQVLAQVVMPEHFHGLIYLKTAGKHHLGQIIRGFMTGCTHGYWDALGIPWQDMKQTVEHGKCDSLWEEKDHRESKRGPSLFVRGYNDTIPITPEEIATKIEYIRTNPERRIIKGELHNRFAIARNQHSTNWTKDAIIRGLKWDWKLSRYADELEKTLTDIHPRLLCPSGVITQGLSLDYIGHRPLLLEKRKLPLICHRADADCFNTQAAAILREARNGAVIVSAFISEKERQIKQLLLQEQLPIIEICDNGFSSRYKPYGKAFYACAEDRLLQITCWQYVYRENYTCTRPECMVMNELARIICKTPDDWWKKA